MSKKARNFVEVPGRHDGLMWEDAESSVSIRIPIPAESYRSLSVTTDGKAVHIAWSKGSVFLRLFAPILENSAGPGQVSKGAFTLPMQKVTAEPWPRLVTEESLEPIDADTDPNVDNELAPGCAGCGVFPSC